MNDYQRLCAARATSKIAGHAGEACNGLPVTFEPDWSKSDHSRERASRQCRIGYVRTKAGVQSRPISARVHWETNDDDDDQVSKVARSNRPLSHDGLQSNISMAGKFSNRCSLMSESEADDVLL